MLLYYILLMAREGFTWERLASGLMGFLFELTAIIGVHIRFHWRDKK